MDDSVDSAVKGMTVNERLYYFDRVDAWDRATRARDRDDMLAVLKRCQFTEEQRIETVDAVLADPKRYGF